MIFEEKAEIVISQLRADRDRLQNTIKQIRSEIMSKDGLEEALEIIDKYREETGEFDNGYAKGYRKALEQPCEDCISRAQALKEADQLDLETFYDNEKVEKMLKGLPPVTLPNSKMELVEDCVSRQAALDVIEREQFKGDAISEIEKLPPVTPQPMKEKWQELKETIVEMRDNNGTGTQQETCKFLANLMDVLEKQMEDKESKEEPCR